ncbi:MAG: hypothetical protein M3373_13595 [Gemmatimonadota bacterium]|nr:hypothetical protein [Gemmatimonadota bacterium]
MTRFRPPRSSPILVLLAAFALVAGCRGEKGPTDPGMRQPPPTGPAPGSTGTLRIRVTTTGASLDPDGYTVVLPNGAGVALAVNGETTIERLAPQQYTITLTGLANNCAVSSQNPLTVAVPPQGTVDAEFTVACTLVPSQRIAFVSTRDGNREIYVLELYGAGEMRLTNTPEDDSDPVWSPDGKRLAYVTQASAASPAQISIVDWENREHGPRLISQSVTVSDGYPAWSPGGDFLAFSTSQFSSNRDIAIMRADGSDRRRLTDVIGQTLRPSWSPDGTRVAFDADLDIWVVNADGTGARPIVQHPSADLNAAWSPDGLKLVFQSSRHGKFDIFVVNADGSNLRRLTSGFADDIDPAWTPDGRIVFASNRSGDLDIYVMDADGDDITRLTRNPGDDFDPAWGR